MSRDGRIWLNQKQMAELFAVTKMNVCLHISNILKEKELDESVVKSFFTTATDGKKYVERSDPSKPNMGLVTWKGGIVRKEDVIVAKNYLTADEIDTLNRITTIFLETAELRVKRRMDLTLQFWIEAVDKMLSSNLFEVLHGQGVVSHETAVEVSSERYAEFDAVRKEEEARLADEADLEELKRIEDEAKKRQGD